ncbi:MAG: two-component regulator propeller domain-containing protein [Steroidobacteraceae bacterium]
MGIITWRTSLSVGAIAIAALQTAFAVEGPPWNAGPGTRAVSPLAGAAYAPQLPIQVRVDPNAVRVPVIDGSDIRFLHLSRAQGLSQSRVTQVVQDDQGFLWFATQYGLDRYDGYRFKVYAHDPNDPGSLCGVYIWSLFKDRSGSIWVGCDNSIDRYDAVTDSFQHFPIGPRSAGSPMIVVHISQGRTGKLWLSTTDGLYRLDPRTGRTTRFAHRANDPLSLSSNDIKFAADDREGNLWVATGEGLDEFDWKGRRVLVHVPLREPSDLSFYEDSHGIFWIFYASGNGLAILDRRTYRLTRYSFGPQELPDHPLTGVSSMIEDRNGTLWLGTLSEGLLKFDRRDQRFIRYRHGPTRPESLSEDRVTTLYEDREGSVWVGGSATPPSYFTANPLPFRSLPFDSNNAANLGERLVNAIFVDHAGALWTGTTGSLNRFDPRTGRYERFTVPGRGVAGDVISIAEDPEGILWVGTFGRGLARFNERTGRIRLYQHRSGDTQSLSNDTVPALLVDRQGRLWAATLDGLDEFEPASGRFVAYRLSGRMAISPFTSLAQARDGSLWVGSGYSGLLRFDLRSHRFTPYHYQRNHPGTLSDDHVNGILVSRSGTIWVSTQNGLDRLDARGGTFKRYSERDGLASNDVSCILQDRSGNLWMGTSSGLSRLDARTHQFTSYGVADGLPGPDLTGWHACFRSADGQMYFGGFSGAIAFRPDQVTTSAYVPPVVLTEFDLFGVPVGLGIGSPLRRAIGVAHQIVLPHDQNSVSFAFAALSFCSPETNRYRYRLLGLESRWREVGSDQRRASYTTLPPGNYLFEAQGATSRGPWSHSTSIRVIILHPWWQMWWFRAAITVLIAVLAAIGYLANVRRLARQLEIGFHERTSERMRIARQLHDSLLQGFQGLMFRLQAVHQMLPAQPEEAALALEHALERGDASIAEARDAVSDLRGPSSDSDLVEALKVLGAEFGLGDSSGSPSYRVVVEGQARAVCPLVRDEIYQVAREAFRNAYQHAKAKQIEIEVNYDSTNLTVRVRDDGLGLDQEVLTRGMRAGHWGLQGMRERTVRLGGKFSVWSEHEAGTEVEIVMPGKVAYLKGTHRKVL